MEIELNKKPRSFKVGINKSIEIKDFGKIKAQENEMVTFVSQNQKEYDVVAKKWGFYATPSINGRLVNEGFKTALVKNSSGLFYIMLVETESTKEFQKYLNQDNSTIVEWLDERK